MKWQDPTKKLPRLSKRKWQRDRGESIRVLVEYKLEDYQLKPNFRENIHTNRFGFAKYKYPSKEDPTHPGYWLFENRSGNYKIKAWTYIQKSNF